MKNWLKTPDGQPRGYIQPQALKELWFHTGTICNLQCPFCLEGAKPGDDRIQRITLAEVKPFMDEAVKLGVDQFSFTGGEPFVIKEIIDILEYALEYKPCLILTNATKPLKQRLSEVAPLVQKPYPLNFRVSLDYPDSRRHDVGRGKGNFQVALETLGELRKQGFNVSIARQMGQRENTESINRKYQGLFQQVGLPQDIKIVRFPDFLTPGSIAQVPQITEDCMTRYHTSESREEFMCNTSKMIAKKEGKTRVFACTLADDDDDYDLGGNLSESMNTRIMLKHHRCYSCFAYGATCSER